jgi:hypothetical protein
MRSVSEVYEEYRIMPLLQLHQLRVAAVAKMVVENFEGTLDERNVTIACLFHDMGNILKSDFSLFPEMLEPQGIVYWQKVKADFARNYGPDEHHATIAIGHELHLPLQAMRYMEGVGFSKLPHTLATPSFEQKIVEYADTRVAPQGVVSQRERMEEAKQRYAPLFEQNKENEERYQEYQRITAEIESQIFARCRIRPEDITEAGIQPFTEELKGFQVA